MPMCGCYMLNDGGFSSHKTKQGPSKTVEDRVRLQERASKTVNVNRVLANQNRALDSNIVLCVKDRQRLSMKIVFWQIKTVF